MGELNLILRTAAVHSAAERQLENTNRINISGIAAITGIPRGDVSRILNSNGSLTIGAIQARQNISSKILNAWHSDPEYLTGARRPRVLKIFGGSGTFESLVRTYGQGIPVRAILDELQRGGAIELLTSSQTIRPKMSLAINPRITLKKIRDFDVATDGLFLCLRCPPDGAFVEKVSGTRVWSGCRALVRRRFGPNAIALLRELQAKLESKEGKYRSVDKEKVAHISVKITYTETHAQLAKGRPRRRRNFDRNR